MTWPLPVPNVMLVAVPPSVAAIVSVLPPSRRSAGGAGRRAGGQAELGAAPEPPMVRSLAVPVCSVIAPAAIAERAAGDGVDRGEQVCRRSSVMLTVVAGRAV